MKSLQWTDEEDALLRTDYPDTPTRQIATRLNISYGAVTRRAYALGLRKSAAYLKSDLGGRISKMNDVGAIYRFVKGQDAANKGAKMSDETRAKCAPYFFKKGYKSPKTGFDGKISVRGQATSNPYYYIRLAENNWLPLHRHNWQQAHGAIPEGYNVQFIDGDWQNCAVSNLRLVSKKENLAQNNISNLPDDVKEAIWLVQSFNRKLNTKIKKRNGNQKHHN